MLTTTLCESSERNTRPPAPSAKGIRISSRLADSARIDEAELCRLLQTSVGGLPKEEAEVRSARYGPNEVTFERGGGWLRRLLSAIRNPLVILLSVLAAISFATGDVRAGSVMSLMVILGVSLRFAQESRADAAAARLRAMISLTATVIREKEPQEVPLNQLVPGDVILLSAGDMVPADVRLITAKDLFVSQATLTGESLPVDKQHAPETEGPVAPLEYTNICFLGTSIESGSARAVVVETGPRTYFGSMAGSILGAQPETSFDKGIRGFTWLMIQFMAVMVPLVFVINGVTKHNWNEAFFLCARRGSRADSRDAAYDYFCVSFQRSDRDVWQEGRRQVVGFNPELWSHGYPLHG